MFRTLAARALPGAFAAESAPAAGQKTLVGSNIYGWGQYAQRDNKKLDVAEVSSALRDTGYDYLETFMAPRQMPSWLEPHRAGHL